MKRDYLVQVCRWCLWPTWAEAELPCEYGEKKSDFLLIPASEMPPDIPKRWYSRSKLRAQNEPIVTVTIEVDP